MYIFTCRAPLVICDLRCRVLQRYIMDPLLYGGKKFHFRVYVLCTGALCVYVCEGAYLCVCAHGERDTARESDRLAEAWVCGQ